MSNDVVNIVKAGDTAGGRLVQHMVSHVQPEQTCDTRGKSSTHSVCECHVCCCFQITFSYLTILLSTGLSGTQSFYNVIAWRVT